jgi:hypothetical protein
MHVQNLAPLSTEKRGTGTEYGVQLADRATQILHIGLMTLCIAWSLSKVLRDKCEIPSSLLQLSVSRRYQVPSTSSNPGPATQLRTDTCTVPRPRHFDSCSPPARRPRPYRFPLSPSPLLPLSLPILL